MSVVVYMGRDGVRVPVAPARLAAIARLTLRSEGVSDAMLSIAFISRRAIAAINRRHLGRSGSTDVIAFGMRHSGAKGPVVGDIYIAPEVARANAVKHGVPVRQEIARLVVHGTLHVLGYDHGEGASRTDSRMWRRQEAILARGMRAGRKS